VEEETGFLPADDGSMRVVDGQRERPGRDLGPEVSRRAAVSTFACQWGISRRPTHEETHASGRPALGGRPMTLASNFPPDLNALMS